MSDATARTVVFLHGVGVGPESWDAQVRALPTGFDGIALPMPGLRDADETPF
ncbi:alpha/beta fold hydrolase [Agromyces aerolatus]|uniref:alpha/beta fold hydrolase n=1 Tax=Agromyces sp. LY-1074 TaxID=3074080 RepID=UPI002867873C|nr:MULTISPECIES: hypothetical protein [unclassified Agromyces]MDR5701788.1 hypothetical protein [Agromyces sp. LY-1074]MDR5708025.1 hypothetical protein [Agromyces sp. LY-1358]